MLALTRSFYFLYELLCHFLDLLSVSLKDSLSSLILPDKLSIINFSGQSRLFTSQVKYMLKKNKQILWNDYFGLRASFPIAQETFCSLMCSLDALVPLSLILSWLTHFHVMATLMSVSILKLTVVPVELLSTRAFHLATPWLHFMTMTFEPMLLVSLFIQCSVHQTFSTRHFIVLPLVTLSLTHLWHICGRLYTDNVNIWVPQYWGQHLQIRPDIQQLVIFTAWQNESKFVHDHTWTCLYVSAHNGDTVSKINKDTPMPTAKGSSN